MNNEQVQTWCRLKQWLTATNLDRGETWGESINQHSRLRTATHVLRWADALTTVQLSTTNPNNPQNTPNPVNNSPINNPSFFAVFF